MNILITGANGFVGKHLAKYLTTQNHTVIAGTRHACPELPQTKQFIYDDFQPSSKWQSALTNIEVVIHCAARIHVLNDQSSEPLTAYREVNTQGTLELAKQALEAGVKRFIFISTIKINTITPTRMLTLLVYPVSKGRKNSQKKAQMKHVVIKPPIFIRISIMYCWVEALKSSI